MATMIETLESRELFSTVSHAAVVLMRKQIAVVGQPLKTIGRELGKAANDMGYELKLYNVPADDALVASMVQAYETDSATLIRDIANAKVLYNRDVNRLTKDITAFHRKPNNTSLAAKITADENLLTAQGGDAAQVIATDGSTLVTDYSGTALAVASSHEIDATLSSIEQVTFSKINVNMNQLVGYTELLSNVDIPTFISAVDPGATQFTGE